jgi:hypothetical protein
MKNASHPQYSPDIPHLTVKEIIRSEWVRSIGSWTCGVIIGVGADPWQVQHCLNRYCSTVTMPRFAFRLFPPLEANDRHDSTRSSGLIRHREIQRPLY